MHTLTPRERRIVDLVCGEGMSRDEAAYEIGRATNTIKSHCTAIFRKLGVRTMNRTCAMWGAERGPPIRSDGIEAMRSADV